MGNSFKNIFKGVVTVDENEGVYTPYRLTNAQLERYKHKPRCPFSKACAGIKMEFITAQREISFSYLCRSVWTHFEGNVPTFDFYVNDIFYRTVEIEKDRLNERFFVKISIDGGKDENKITIYFPHNAAVSVSDIDIGVYKCTADKERKLLVYGDSISQGLMGNTSSMSYTENYARFFDMNILNLSVGGDVFDEEAIDEKLNYAPTDVIVALGINDAEMITDFELIGKSIKKYLAKIKRLYSLCNVMVITPTVQLSWREKGCEKHKILEEIRSLLRSESKKYGFLCVEGEKLLPAEKRFYIDDTHPNDLGFSQYALNLIKEQLKNKKVW